jgi:DNA-binding NarL/FixJ family response regulator
MPSWLPFDRVSAMSDKTRILIVDDHFVVIKGIKSVLAGYPEFEVVGVAGNGEGAIEKTKALGPDLVIMDISMPGVNGIEATRAIIKTDEKVKIIVFTMSSDKEDILTLFREGVAGYVIKDAPLDDLISALEAVKMGGTYYCQPAQQIIHDHMAGLEKGLGRGTHLDRLDSLSKREMEIFPLLADGLSVKEIAEKLCISGKTVESHKYNIMQKLGADSLAELTKIAVKKKLIEP